MEVMEAIGKRRSYKKYKTDLVDDKTVEKVLEAARQAPSWANTQCWRFIVVRDSETRAQLSSTGVGENNPAALAIRDTPVAIAVCARLGESGYIGGKLRTDKGDSWYMFDVALAVQNLSLAAHSLGLGTRILGWFDAKRAASILGVPEGFCVVAMTPLGYPLEEPPVRPRKELPEIVFYDKFGTGKP